MHEALDVSGQPGMRDFTVLPHRVPEIGMSTAWPTGVLAEAAAAIAPGITTSSVTVLLALLVSDSL